jgi:probable HAF family extracellular repeat protein
VPAFVAGLLLTAVVSAQEYEVTDLGAIGDNGNMAWSLSQHGDVCGWSYFINSGTEGFFYSQGRLRYVGFVGGRSSSYVVAANNLGHAIGSSGTVHEEPRAFVWLGTHKVNLGTLGGDDSRGSGINDLGQAVGQSKLPDDSWRGFIWENGQMRALPTLPGGVHAGADWINNAGQIIGSSTNDPNSLQYHGVIWEDEQVYRLPPLDSFAAPQYIHDNGDIAGYARVPRSRAVIWRDREIVLQLGTLADGTRFEDIASSYAYGINADGVIVGMSTNATGDGTVPFVYRDGEMIQLDDLMPEPWEAYTVGPGSINDAGQIAVQAGFGGTSHALLLTPIARETICPDDPGDFLKSFGGPVTGDALDLCGSDDVRLEVRQLARLSPLLPFIRLEFWAHSTADTPITSVDYTIEGHVSALVAGGQNPDTLRTSIMNYNTGLFEIIDERGTGASADETINHVQTTNAPDYVNAGDGEVRVQQEVFSPGDVFSPNWFLKVDLYEVAVMQ